MGWCEKRLVARLAERGADGPALDSFASLSHQGEREGRGFTKLSKPFCLVVEPHRRQHADWGRSATAAAFHPFRGLRHSMARRYFCINI